MNDFPAYTTPEGLRMLLFRLAYTGPRVWEHDSEASELMTFTMTKYGALARKYGLEPSDAAIAAFEVMSTRAARVARDPWAVVTHAVQMTLIYEARAQGLLCSTHQARRPALSCFHDAERFSDRESNLADYHPAFHTEDDMSGFENAIDEPDQDEPTNAYFAMDVLAAVFVELGWQPHTARFALEYIGARLIRTGSREGAFESLRRDRQLCALIDLDQRSWIAVLRAVLGNQNPERAHTSAGRGAWLRVLIGQRREELFADTDFADAIEAAAPEVQGSSHV